MWYILYMYVSETYMDVYSEQSSLIFWTHLFNILSVDEAK